MIRASVVARTETESIFYSAVGSSTADIAMSAFEMFDALGVTVNPL